MGTYPILVVDDDKAIRDLIKAVLQDEGYAVLTAENGYQALAILQEQPVSLILLDLQMPVMDGWQLLAVYQDFRQCAPVILLSANQVAHNSLPSIVVAFLPKPFAVADLLNLVDCHLKAPL